MTYTVMVNCNPDVVAIERAGRFPEARAPRDIRVGRNYTQDDFGAVGM